MGSRKTEIALKDAKKLHLDIMEAGYSIRSFAAKAEIDYNHLTVIIREERQPGFYIADRIRKTLGRDFTDLFFIRDKCSSNKEAVV